MIGSEVGDSTHQGRRDWAREWAGPAFQQAAAQWVDHRLAGLGMERVGAMTPVRIRFWSAVHRIEVRGGAWDRVYFKAANPGQGFEGSLLAALGGIVPQQMVAPLAVDAQRAWWLLPDGGTTLADVAGTTGTAGTWSELLAQVARLQQRLITERAALPFVPEAATSELVETVERLVDEGASLSPDDPQFLPAAFVAMARAGYGRLELAVRTLTQLVPDTLQPNDVSLGNAVQPHTASGPYRLFDLGDSLWSHPFGVLHLPLRLANGVPLTGRRPDGPTTEAIVAAYLGAWSQVPQHQWPDVLDAADRVGAIHRALSWRRLLNHVTPDALPDPPRLSAWLHQAIAHARHERGRP